MTDIAKKFKNASQDVEAKIKTEEDHAKGKPSSETLSLLLHAGFVRSNRCLFSSHDCI